MPRTEPVTKTCGCGRRFATVGCNAVRCPECRRKYTLAYAHAYSHGIVLDRDNWRDYYAKVYGDPNA